MRCAIRAAMLLLAGVSGVACAESRDPKAEEVIARARTTQSTYTIYWRIRVADTSSKPEYAWAATFRRGPLVRMENLEARAVADCNAGTGTQYHLTINNDYLVGSKVAKRYCGINEDRKISSTRWLGQKESEIGLVDEVQVVNQDGTNTYLITGAGEIVSVISTFRGSNVAVVAEPMVFERSVPAGDLFSRRSLASSMVPKKLQSQASRAEH